MGEENRGKKIVISDYYYENLNLERREIARLKDAELFDYHCKTEEEVIEAARDADVLIVQFAPITKRVIESLEHCKLIVRYAIGVDNIDVSAASEKGIYVANVPDYSLDEVSNHAIALLMACARKLPSLASLVKEGKWDYSLVKPLYRMEGKVLGLVGLGRIPALVAKKMAGFGMRMIAYDPYMPAETAKELGVELVDFETLLAESDYISVHCPLNGETRHLFDYDKFKKMKRTAFIINTARGGVICEEDLIKALKEGEIAGAGIDVCEKEPIDPDSPLLKMEQAIVTPHVAWYSEEAVKSLQKKVAEEAVRVLSGEKPLHPVNVLGGEKPVCQVNEPKS